MKHLQFEVSNCSVINKTFNNPNAPILPAIPNPNPRTLPAIPNPNPNPKSLASLNHVELCTESSFGLNCTLLTTLCHKYFFMLIVLVFTTYCAGELSFEHECSDLNVMYYLCTV